MPARFVKPANQDRLVHGLDNLSYQLSQYNGKATERDSSDLHMAYRTVASWAVHTQNGVELPRPLSVLWRAVHWAAGPNCPCHRPSRWPQLEETGSTKATPKLARDWAALMQEYVFALRRVVESGEYGDLISRGTYMQVSKALNQRLHAMCGRHVVG